MKKILKTRMLKRTLLSLSLAIMMIGGVFVYNASAGTAVTIDPATGAGSVSIDTTSYTGGASTWTSLTLPKITENGVGEISTGTHYLNLPSGWVFDTETPLTVSVLGGTGMIFGEVYYNSPTQIVFTILGPSLTSSGKLTFSDIKVKPTGNRVSSGNITHAGAAITGVDGGTNFGTLTTVAGAVTKLAFTTEPVDTVYGSTITSVVKTQDQFGNNSVNGLVGSETVTIAKGTGTGTLSGTVTGNIGTSGQNGTLTFNNLKFDNVGIFTLEAQGSAYTLATSSSFEVTPKTITASMSVNNKNYDGNDSATIDGLDPVGVESGDTVTLSGGTATFSDKNVDTGKTVSATGIEMGGAQSAKYSYDGTATATANISAIEITLGGSFTANNKTYDRGTAATVASDSLTFTGLISGDDLTFSPAPTFASATVGDEKTVSITDGSWGGADKDNYTFSLVGAPTATANITAKQLYITGSFTPASKTYDKTTSASLDSNNIGLSGIISGDAVSFDWGAFNFDNVNKGTGKTVTGSIVLTGADKDNYSLPNSGTITSSAGVITARTITLGGTLVVYDRAYNGNRNATIDYSSSLPIEGAIEGDGLGLTPYAQFSDKNVGDEKEVTITSTSAISGAAAANYVVSLVGAPTAFAKITPVAITVTAQHDSKTYDGDATSDVSPIITLGALIAGDNGIYLESYNNKNVGTGKTLTPSVTSIKDSSDADMTGNYTVTLVDDTTGVISAKELTVTGAAVTSKVYDNNRNAVITGATLSGVIGEDDVTLSNNTAGAFNNEHAGNNKSVTTLPMTIIGDDISNYSLTQPTLTGNITARPINVSAQTDSKIYNNNNLSSVLPIGDALLESDTYTSVGTQTFSDKYVGLDKTITAANAVINDGNDGQDYDITYVDASGSIISGPLHHFNVTTSTLTPNTGTPIDLTITAVDRYDNTISAASGVTPYTGKAYISTNASQSYNLPLPYAYVSGDEGTKTFVSGALFKVAQNDVSISVRDGDNATIVGELSGLNVSNTADVVAPVISAISVTPTQSTASVDFTSGEAGTAKVGYGLTATHGNMTSYLSMASGDNSIVLSGLTCGTTYHYAVYGKDASGNESISSDATFRTDACTEPTEVSVTRTSLVKRVATKNGQFADGWKWILDVTLPTNSTTLSMSFNNLTGAGTIQAANNIRFYSNEASTSTPTVITAAGAGTAWSNSISLNKDLDTVNPGRQIQITVEAAVPSGSIDGAYSAAYDIRAIRDVR
ncbi:MAG: YDG domain-containing protein [Candidatus Falkowbacteria bacterium]